MKTAADPTNVRTVPAGEFKAKCLQLLENVKREKASFVITKRGVPYGTLVPYAKPKKSGFRPVLGRSPQTRILGDIISPLPEEDMMPGDIFPHD